MSTKKKSYFQKYRIAWQDDELLKGWIIPHPDNSRRVNCKYCCCELRAHKKDLYKHFHTQKHKRHLKNSPSFPKQITNLVISESKPLKAEKIVTADGSYIIIESAHGILNSQKANSSCVSPNYKSIQETVASQPINESHPRIETSELQSQEESIELDPAFNSEQEITEVVNRVGCVLMNDMTKILRMHKNVMKFFKTNGELIFNEASLRKMAKICVGQLSHKYLADSAFEFSRMHPPKLKEQVDLKSDFQSIEQKLEKTLGVMKHLKTCFEGISDVLPSTPIDLADVTSLSYDESQYG